MRTCRVGQIARALVLGLTGMLITEGAAAQSLFGSAGLGVPVDAVGARARALASVGVGVRGPELHPLDPAAAADFPLPFVNVTLIGTRASFTAGDGDGKASGQRFPVLGVLFPVGRYGNVSATFSTVFDLRWGTTVTRTVELGEVIGLAKVTDQFASDGGVTALRLGWSKRLSSRLAVGVSGGPYLGDAIRSFLRSVDSTGVAGNVEPTVAQGAWDFSGYTATAGVGMDFGNSFHFAGSVTMSSGLDATPKGGTTGGVLSYDLPLEWRGGMTVNVTPDLTAVGSIEVASYDKTIGDEAPVATRGSMMDWGVGAEFTQLTLGGLSVPLRLGYGKRELPFLFDQGPGDESFVTGGLGLNFVVIQGTPLARLDFSVERGSREAPSLMEKFWRMGLSLQISGL